MLVSSRDLLSGLLQRITSLDRELGSNTAGCPEYRDVPLTKAGIHGAEVFAGFPEKRRNSGAPCRHGKSNLFHKTIQ
jgi:hypothetical protein